ncbi:hypothetical protein Ga0100231_006680 [Opitutaceae bacterium TAV4]|nr:hypothetical protein Ga0100231_006680 [Opitutaceae bacterium TAV4]
MAAEKKRHDFKIKGFGPVHGPYHRGAYAGARSGDRPARYRLRKGGKLLYRQPAYLLCHRAGLPVQDILQQYLWRWDIEVNFKDEKKNLLGVSQAQVRSPETVIRQPAGAGRSTTPCCSWPPTRLRTGQAAAGRASGPVGDGANPLAGRPPACNQPTARRTVAAASANQSLSHFTRSNPPNHNAHKPPHLPDLDLASAVFYSHN